MPMEPGTKADLHILCDMAEGVPQGTTPVMYAMCLLHGISQPAPRYEALDVYVCSVFSHSLGVSTGQFLGHGKRLL